MKLSNYPLRTLKDAPSDAELISHQLMLRSGLIKKLASGIFTWMPFGLKVLRKIEQTVRNEMDESGALEVLMPTIQPSELWQETQRWDDYGNLLLQIHDRHDRLFCYGPTHEEVITDILRKSIKSYKQLPANFYQIQTKFRDEIRPRFGVMRAREFLMKDAYSFHLNQESLEEEYEKMSQTYESIFRKLELNFRKVKATSGEIGGSISHEFHVIAESGEDEIAFCDGENFAANVETLDGKNAPNGGELTYARGIEVGHIFQLGDKYSQSMKLEVLDSNGKNVNPYMGCYGIGISRIVAAAIEQNHDDKGIIWPKAISPFAISIIVLNDKNDSTVMDHAIKIYQELRADGIEVMIDDRDERAGVKFADADLMGIPTNVIVGKRGIEQNKLEITSRRTGETTEVKINEIVSHLKG
ncbi:MAG: proline--tRNA ligase [Gammaproteobacteria bacterium]|nr:proline--tRNA ligase [Gammaproteobacteria bacterium]RZO96876.1 MAG: proline--tRNA ligase [Gammaproteobacteria bacterium]|tara:strand:- start:606 stop:1844 length:1239 start_codon:yes stop_codon:yes gene_type:complete